MVNVGLVGVGAWGRNLLRNLAAAPNVCVAALCDPEAEVRKSISQQHRGAAAYEDFDAFLRHPLVDAVVIATPSGLHFGQARSAIEAGLHALVEKPMCMTSREARMLIELAKRKQRVLMVGHTFLYSNLVHEVKRRITSGELGEVLCIYSQRLNLGRVRSDVDALWNFAPHDISIVGYLLDDWPSAVNARGAGFIQRSENIADIAFFQMDFPQNRFVSGHVSWLDPQKVRRMVVVGSEKMLVYDDVDSERHIQIYDKCVEREFQSSAADFCDFRTKVRAGDLCIPNVRLVEPLGVEIAHFVECIRTGATPRSDGINGLRVIAVLEAMSASMRAGGARIEVNYGEPTQPPHRVSGRKAAFGAVPATAV